MNFVRPITDDPTKNIIHYKSIIYRTPRFDAAFPRDTYSEDSSASASNENAATAKAHIFATRSPLPVWNIRVPLYGPEIANAVWPAGSP